VIESPGHSPGHISFWRERDRVLIIGDVVFNLNPFIGTTGLQLPPNLFTVDPPMNRKSAHKLAALKPEIVCFGHGPVVRDVARVLDFISGLRS
jgi:hydroxyacylglutathione hydrolase